MRYRPTTAAVRRRMRRRRWCTARTVLRLGRHRLLYAGRWPFAVLAAVVSAAALAIGLVRALPPLAVAPVAVIAAWALYAMRWRRLVPAGTGGLGPDEPGGAGVREPRRPRPKGPAGAAERPLPVA